MSHRAADPRAKSRKQAIVRELCDDIRTEAYYLWQKRGCPHGSAWIDWFRAEEKVISAATAAPPARR